MQDGKDSYKKAYESWREQTSRQDLDLDFSSLNEYIRDMIRQNLSDEDPEDQDLESEPTPAKQPIQITPQIFEIIGYTIVKIPLPDGIEQDWVQLGVDTRELIIKIGDEVAQMLVLPKKSIPESAKAYYHNQYIEVHIPHDPKRTFLNIPIVSV